MKTKLSPQVLSDSLLATTPETDDFEFLMTTDIDDLMLLNTSAPGDQALKNTMILSEPSF